ncbi:helix-turn-helix transcriptional regulator [Kineobactrum sediminis]|uniref:Helix-turn-helix transcriptional regulator n=1 Tax=Kineobactrum sediminis TaxID=1905677 RepID=A0A2N5Y415_9GAMM|nr:helix-turn-helix transcriptional regulator [Kineobactrum sediminis]PLW83140.1 helix-turn-helix transcriptional regulator [Kineobactrum sediminis]
MNNRSIPGLTNLATTPVDYDALIAAIYRGPLETQPWSTALPLLREIMDSHVVSLVLRPPAKNDRGVILNSVRPTGDPASTTPAGPLSDAADWEVTAYREQFFALDPFVNLPVDKVVALADILDDEALVASEYYEHYLRPAGLFRILGLDTVEPGGMLARLRFSRRREEPPFTPDERALLARIAPHIRLAIQIHATIGRTASERNLYAGAVEQLAVATIILDEQGHVLSTNTIARALLEDADGLTVRGQHLLIEGRDRNRELQNSLATIVEAQHRGETSVVKALRVPRSGGRSQLGLVLRPVPVSEWSEGQTSPCVAVFISDPELSEPASQGTLGELFDLTPAEANLAVLLSRGLRLAEVSEAQNISPHTARAQLKSIFAKTGVSRQAELVRLVLKSVASLG